MCHARSALGGFLSESSGQQRIQGGHVGKIVATIPQQAHEKIHLDPRITSNSETQQEGAEEMITLKPRISAEEGAKAQRGEDMPRITQPISDRE